MAPRILGRNCILMVNSQDLLLPVALGELDQFTATSNTDIVKRRPIGYSIEAATERYGGYDLTLKVGKTDPMLERWNHLVERGIFAGNKQPELFITEIVKHYKTLPVVNIPITECWIYRNVTLFGLDKSTDANEIEQNIKGFATHKEIGPVDTTYINLQWFAGIGFQEVVHRTAQTSIDIGGMISSILSKIP